MQCLKTKIQYNLKDDEVARFWFERQGDSSTSPLHCSTDQPDCSSKTNTLTDTVLKCRPDPLDVFKLLQTKCFDWDAIGRELQISYDYRQDLNKLNGSVTNASKLEKVIMKWVESETCEVSWNSVIEMLKRLKYMAIASKVNEYLLSNPAAKKYYKEHSKRQRSDTTVINSEPLTPPRSQQRSIMFVVFVCGGLVSVFLYYSVHYFLPSST